MDLPGVLALFDREMREDPPPEPDVLLERGPDLVRGVGLQNFILYSAIPADRIVDRVRAEVENAQMLGKELSWNVYGHDRPGDLAEVLRSAGFVGDETESLMLFDLSGGPPSVEPVSGLAIRRLTETSEVDVAMAVSSGAFGRDERERGERFKKRIADPSLALFLASIEGTPVAFGRVDLPSGRSFAGLWGGGTLPPYRSRGIYRNLVAARGALAHERGFRYLLVEARESSRPILERLGFELATSVREWVYTPVGVHRAS
ncbi:MAG: GNAT family N-acetyltransferase [Thermoplasmata archaeon]|nr:GNAT family N-acetyltransferase [Thermoplasmata archaeon]